MSPFSYGRAQSKLGMRAHQRWPSSGPEAIAKSYGAAPRRAAIAAPAAATSPSVLPDRDLGEHRVEEFDAHRRRVPHHLDLGRTLDETQVEEQLVGAREAGIGCPGLDGSDGSRRHPLLVRQADAAFAEAGGPERFGDAVVEVSPNPDPIAVDKVVAPVGLVDDQDRLALHRQHQGRLAEPGEDRRDVRKDVADLVVIGEPEDVRVAVERGAAHRPDEEPVEPVLTRLQARAVAPLGVLALRDRRPSAQSRTDLLRRLGTPRERARHDALLVVALAVALTRALAPERYTRTASA